MEPWVVIAVVISSVMSNHVPLPYRTFDFVEISSRAVSLEESRLRTQFKPFSGNDSFVSQPIWPGNQALQAHAFYMTHTIYIVLQPTINTPCEMDNLNTNYHTNGIASCELPRDQEGGSNAVPRKWIDVANQGDDFEAKSIDYWRKRWLIRTTTRTRDNKMMYAVCRGSIDLFMKSIAPSRDTSFEYLRRYGLLILLAFVAILTRLRPTSFEYNHRAMKSILFLVFAAMLPPTMLACDDEYDSHSLYLDPFTLSDHYRIGASKIDLQSAFVFQSLSPNSVEKSLRIISLEESSIASSFVLHPETPFEMDSRASAPSERASRPSTDNAPQGPVSRPSTDHASKRTLLSTINARREMDHLNPNCHDNVIASCGLSQDQECDTTWINVPNQGIQHDDPATRDEWFGYLCYGLMILFSFLVILTRSTKSILFIVFAAILPPTAATIDATVSVNMDNSGTISLATDGVSFTQIATIADWHDTEIVVIPEVDITPSTIIQFECVDAGSVGGFIANVNYKNIDYYTTNPFDASLFEIISSSDGITSPLAYTANGASPWGSTTSTTIPANAYWVWNGQSYNTMEFHFSFATLATTEYPSKYPSDYPSKYPSGYPSAYPSSYPSTLPTKAPARLPSTPTTQLPSFNPSYPTELPSSAPTTPSLDPTERPSANPTTPTANPSQVPTDAPLVRTTEITQQSKGENDSSKDDMQAGSEQDMMVVAYAVSGVCALLLCICVPLAYLIWARKKRAKIEELFGKQELDPVESGGKSQDTQHATNIETNVQPQNTANNAFPISNNPGSFGTAVHVPQQVVAASTQPIAEAIAQDGGEGNAQSACTDCGQVKAGTTYDGLFYCNECFQAYE
eukprot:185192_1